MPLERDEGEYAYAGQLILKGVPPYKLVYNMKLPGTYFVYAAILEFFGQTEAGIHIGLLLVNGGTTLLLYFLVRKLRGDLAGAAAAGSYALLSTSEAVLGLAGHATHFVVLMEIAGLLCLMSATRSDHLKAYFAGGVFMGLAFLMKQPGLLFVLFGAQEIFMNSRKAKAEGRKAISQLGIYAAGAALPYLLTCALLYRAGVFPKFWFWTVSYATVYATSTSLLDGIASLILKTPHLFLAAPVVWSCALIALIAAIKEQGMDAAMSFDFRLLVCSFLAASAGLYYRDHYFILLLPAICLLAGSAVKQCTEWLATRIRLKMLVMIPPAVFLAGFVFAIYAQRKTFFENSPAAIIREVYVDQQFPEALEFGKYIRKHSKADSKVAVLGSEPEIYFYADRRSATGYIYTYGLMEKQPYASQMQREMMSEIENERPEYVVMVNNYRSWGIRPDSDTAILLWARKYVSEGYMVVGVADTGIETTYVWDAQAEGYTARSKYSLLLYKRKESITRVGRREQQIEGQGPIASYLHAVDLQASFFEAILVFEDVSRHLEGCLSLQSFFFEFP